MNAPAQAGVCRFCGVTDAQIDGDKLWWISRERDCCNKYGCVKADLAEQRRRPLKPRRQRSEFAELIAKGYGFGAACEEMRRRKRRKGKAA